MTERLQVLMTRTQRWRLALLAHGEDSEAALVRRLIREEADRQGIPESPEEVTA